MRLRICWPAALTGPELCARSALTAGEGQTPGGYDSAAFLRPRSQRIRQRRRAGLPGLYASEDNDDIALPCAGGLGRSSFLCNGRQCMPRCAELHMAGLRKL